jgi:hypothetical protein
VRYDPNTVAWRQRTKKGVVQVITEFSMCVCVTLFRFASFNVIYVSDYTLFEISC